MNLPRKYLYTDDAPAHELDLDPPAAFGPTYGNRGANGKRFRQPWSHQHRKLANPLPREAELPCAEDCG